MKFLSNFDSTLNKKLYDEACAKFGREHVLHIRRHRIYLLLRLRYPLGIRLLFAITCLWLYYGVIGTEGIVAEYIGLLVWTLVFAVTLYLFYYVGRKLTDYYMDFVIITPKQLEVYDQNGMLNRTTKSVDVSKIKTINIRTDGLLCSIFNYGSVVFLAEGDADNSGEITLNYITNPVKLRARIQDIIEEHDSAQMKMNKEDSFNKNQEFQLL